MAPSATETGLAPLPLPEGITESYVALPSRGLNMHCLSSGSPSATHPQNPKPLVVLLHGFPELAFSWRHVMPSIADAGYHVVAPDQRGYGRTTGWDTRSFHEVDLGSFSLSGLVADVLALVSALGYKEVACIVGHDFGAVSGSLCALMRGDVFRSVIIMSVPFRNIPSFPFNTATSPYPPAPSPLAPPSKQDIQTALASLAHPRKHYQHYYSTSAAAPEMDSSPPEMAPFLRGYFHFKSGDWPGNAPHRLAAFTAPELAKMPGYYIMPLALGMRATIAAMLSTDAAAKKHLDTAEDGFENGRKWLSDADLAVYAAEWSRTGFQGGLNWYRVASDRSGVLTRDMAVWAGRKIEVPSLFLSGGRDWGMYQEPGALEGMGGSCADFRGVKVVEGAGHWVQQERAAEVVEAVLAFLGEVAQREGSKI